MWYIEEECMSLCVFLLPCSNDYRGSRRDRQKSASRSPSPVKQKGKDDLEGSDGNRSPVEQRLERYDHDSGLKLKLHALFSHITDLENFILQKGTKAC